jgi:PleD family two-component response regulator
MNNQTIRKVLIIDSENGVLGKLVLKLVCSGYLVVRECNFTAALQQIEIARPTLILCGSEFSEAERTDFINTLHQTPSTTNIGIIAFTESTSPDNRADDNQNNSDMIMLSMHCEYDSLLDAMAKSQRRTGHSPQVDVAA